MDEVFGNSSTETVVSVHALDIRAETTEGTTQKETEEVCDDYPFSDAGGKKFEGENKSISKTIHESDESKAPKSNRENQPNCVSVIKCASNIFCNNQETDKAVFRVPLLSDASLKHAQSDVVSRANPGVYSRVRAHSTTVTPQSTMIALKHHPYQNISLNSPSSSHIVSFHSYANLPSHKVRRSYNLKSGDSPSQLNKANSSPSTPRGSQNSSSSNVSHSYIQLWTGEDCGPKDQDSPQQRTGTGYVSMTSPYIRSPNSSILSDLASQLSTHTGNSGSKDIFCPFCPRPFTQELNLKHHIQAIHRHELKMITSGGEHVEVQFCPLCRTRFFNLTLLPSHLLEFHRDDIVDILDKHETIKIDGNEVKCPFCVKKVPASKIGEDILLFHVLQLHSVEYERLVRSLFEPVRCIIGHDSLNKLSTEDLAHAMSFKPGLTSTPGLSLKFKAMSCVTESSFSQESHTNLEETWSSHCAERSDKSELNCTNRLESKTANKGILRSHTVLSRKPSTVKRELRFSVPPVTSEEFYIPESPESQESNRKLSTGNELAEQDENECPTAERQNIPVRVDSLSSADFIEMTNLPRRKRRSLGIGLKSKKSFKKKKRDTSLLVENVFDGLKSIGYGKPPQAPSNHAVIATPATRIFRKPKPVSPPTVPTQASEVSTPTTSTASTSILASFLKPKPVPPPPSRLQTHLPQVLSNVVPETMVPSAVPVEETLLGASPFGSMKLYSPLRLFRCNSCRVKFCDNESLGSHIRGKHRGFLGLLRPQFGCGICSAKFYENKYLVKHCLQHHTSLLEIRSPKQHKITIYRFSQD